MFPTHRMRRLRKSAPLRKLISETYLSIDHFILPLFVEEERKESLNIRSMPGVKRLSYHDLLKECEEVSNLGIPGIMLFGIPKQKDNIGSGSLNEDGVIQQALRLVKKEFPQLIVITDVCLCDYTDHGHCGVVLKSHHGKWEIDNDKTIQILAKQSVSYAQAGADIVAPSDMMDGRVAAIRSALDKAGFYNTPILSYAAKYASAFYCPFREAAGSAPQFGDRRSHQMDPANSREALEEVEMDIEEGADIVMVKPALAYLDILYQVKNRFNIPVAAYSVSGEYSTIMAGGLQGWIDSEQAMMEILLSIKRAGADIIFTYFAKQAAALLAKGY